MAETTYNLEDLEDDLERYAQHDDHADILVVVEIDGKRRPIISVEAEDEDRNYDLVILHVGEDWAFHAQEA